MGNKRSLEEEINDFLEKWDVNVMNNFLRDVIPLIELYDVDENDDWVKDAVGEENERNVRLIRTVYLVSRIAEYYSGIFAALKMDFRNLHWRMEKKEIIEVENDRGL